MQLDIHYYAVYYLGLASGLKPEDAYIMAYSSQYVDDAKEYQKVILIDKDEKEKEFDPICTQHMSLHSFSEAISDKVYFPFHFIPICSGDSPDERAITRPITENEIHQHVFLDALNSNDFYRLGIALHAFADSYSHQEFSGEWSTLNEVRRMRCVLRRRVMPSNLLSSLYLIVLEYFKRLGRSALSSYAPEIGHLRAYKVPDYPHAVWRYKNYDDRNIKRSNPDEYIKCGLEMYRYLGKIEKTGGSPSGGFPLSNAEVKTTIQQAVYIPGPARHRIKYWKEQIIELAKSFGIPNIQKYLIYDPVCWKADAFLESQKTLNELKPLPDRPYRVKGTFDDFKNSHFYKYHVAARQQRINVLEAIKDTGKLPRVELSLFETNQKKILE
jgi:hypothetical protein